jgi:hypothetical protein
MTSPGETAMDYQMVPDNGQGAPERTPDPADAILTADPRSPTPAASGYTGATASGSAAGEPGAPGKTDAERPWAAPAPHAEPEPARPYTCRQGPHTLARHPGDVHRRSTRRY